MQTLKERAERFDQSVREVMTNVRDVEAQARYIEAAIEQIVHVGKGLGQTRAAVKAMLPRVSLRVTWPDGVEAEAPAPAADQDTAGTDERHLTDLHPALDRREGQSPVSVAAWEAADG